jgi:hypothetical protein
VLGTFILDKVSQAEWEETEKWQEAFQLD